MEFRNFKAVFPGALEDIVNITGYAAPDNATGTTAYPTVRGFFKQFRDIFKRCKETKIQQSDVRDFCRYLDVEPKHINDDQLRRLGPVFFRIASTITTLEDEQ
jgi:hypothetical protein